MGEAIGLARNRVVSLINDMLRDLESREVSPPAEPVRTATGHRRKNLPGWPIAVAALVAVGLLAGWLVQQQREASPPMRAAGSFGAADEAAGTQAPDNLEPTASGSETGSGQAGGVDANPRSTQTRVEFATTAEAEPGLAAGLRPAAKPHDEPEPIPEARPESGPDIAPREPDAPAPAKLSASAEPAALPAARPEPASDRAPAPGAQHRDDDRAPDIIVRRSGGGEDSAGEALDSARRALARGRPGVAISRLEQLLARQSEHHEARILLARTLAATGRVRRAEELLAAGLELEAGPAELAFWLARFRLDRGAESSALDVLEGHAPPVSGNTDYHLLIAATMRQLARHEPALEAYRAIAAAAPDNGRAWLGAALSLEALGRRDGAREAYRNAIAGDHEASARFARQRLAVIGKPGGEPDRTEPDSTP